MVDIEGKTDRGKNFYPGSPGEKFYQVTGGNNMPKSRLMELGLTEDDIKNGRPQLRKRNLLVEMTPEFKRLDRMDHNINISKTRGGFAAEIDFYIGAGLSPLQVGDAYYLETGERLSHKVVKARFKHIDRSRVPPYNPKVIRWDMRPQEEREAYVAPWVQLKPLEGVLNDNSIYMGDIWSYAVQAEMLLMGTDQEREIHLAEKFATGLLFYARLRSVIDPRISLEGIIELMKTPSEQKQIIIERSSLVASQLQTAKGSFRQLELPIADSADRISLLQLKLSEIVNPKTNGKAEQVSILDPSWLEPRFIAQMLRRQVQRVEAVAVLESVSFTRLEKRGTPVPASLFRLIERVGMTTESLLSTNGVKALPVAGREESFSYATYFKYGMYFLLLSVLGLKLGTDALNLSAADWQGKIGTLLADPKNLQVIRSDEIYLRKLVKEGKI